MFPENAIPGSAGTGTREGPVSGQQIPLISAPSRKSAESRMPPFPMFANVRNGKDGFLREAGFGFLAEGPFCEKPDFPIPPIPTFWLNRDSGAAAIWRFGGVSRFSVLAIRGFRRSRVFGENEEGKGQSRHFGNFARENEGNERFRTPSRGRARVRAPPFRAVHKPRGSSEPVACANNVLEPSHGLNGRCSARRRPCDVNVGRTGPAVPMSTVPPVPPRCHG